MGLLSKWLFGLGLSVILVGIGTIVTFQESILYIPVINNWRTPADNPSGYHHPGQRSLEYEDVRIETPDGENIHGWFIPAPRGQDASLAPTVLFCHENAGNIGLRVDEFDHMHKKLKVNQLVFDYRGYGYSTGAPSEAGLVTDTVAAYGWLMEKAGRGELDGSRVLLAGRSLGGAVAVAAAARLLSDSS